MSDEACCCASVDKQGLWTVQEHKKKLPRRETEQSFREESNCKAVKHEIDAMAMSCDTWTVWYGKEMDAVVQRDCSSTQTLLLNKNPVLYQHNVQLNLQRRFICATQMKSYQMTSVCVSLSLLQFFPFA